MTRRLRTFVVRPKNLSGSSTSILMGSSAEMDLTLKAVRTSSSDAPGGTSTGSDADTLTYSTRRDSCNALVQNVVCFHDVFDCTINHDNVFFLTISPYQRPAVWQHQVTMYH
jgi:hypothetical protein